MADNNRSHTQTDTHGDEDDQHGHCQHDLRHHNGNIQHKADELFPAELELLQADTAQHTDDNADDRSQHGNDQRVDQRLPQIVVAEGEELAVPLRCKACPRIVALGIVEREGDHHHHRDIEHGVDERRVEICQEFAALLPANALVFNRIHHSTSISSIFANRE